MTMTPERAFELLTDVWNNSSAWMFLQGFDELQKDGIDPTELLDAYIMKEVGELEHFEFPSE